MWYMNDYNTWRGLLHYHELKIIEVLRYSLRYLNNWVIILKRHSFDITILKKALHLLVQLESQIQFL